MVTSDLLLSTCRKIFDGILLPSFFSLFLLLAACYRLAASLASLLQFISLYQLMSFNLPVLIFPPSSCPFIFYIPQFLWHLHICTLLPIQISWNAPPLSFFSPLLFLTFPSSNLFQFHTQPCGDSGWKQSCRDNCVTLLIDRARHQWPPPSPVWCEFVSVHGHLHDCSVGLRPRGRYSEITGHISVASISEKKNTI